MKKIATISKLALAAAIGSLATGAIAHESGKGEPMSGYTTGSSGVVKDPYNLCWRAGSFTPAQAIEECDPDLIPKKPEPAPAPPPPPPPAPKVEAPKIVISKVNLEADTYFDFDKATLKPEGKAKIDQEVAKMNQVELNLVIAVGHTDSIGSEAYNQKLSVRRAEAVKAYMVSKGVPADLIKVSGMGESQPIATNKTRDGRAKNRRVEIEFRATQKKTVK